MGEETKEHRLLRGDALIRLAMMASQLDTGDNTIELWVHGTAPDLYEALRGAESDAGWKTVELHDHVRVVARKGEPL